MLDSLEFEFDEVLIELRKADEKGKFPRKLQVESKTLQTMVRQVADAVLDRGNQPIRW